ncbi:hypothetical protein MRX96_000576 [Rhipicephalus microplus]
MFPKTRRNKTVGRRTRPAQQQQHDFLPSLARLVRNLAPTLQKNMYAENSNSTTSTNINVITISSRRTRAPSVGERACERNTQLRLAVWYAASPMVTIKKMAMQGVMKYRSMASLTHRTMARRLRIFASELFSMTRVPSWKTARGLVFASPPDARRSRGCDFFSRAVICCVTSPSSVHSMFAHHLRCNVVACCYTMRRPGFARTGYKCDEPLKNTFARETPKQFGAPRWRNGRSV